MAVYHFKMEWLIWFLIVVENMMYGRTIEATNHNMSMHANEEGYLVYIGKVKEFLQYQKRIFLCIIWYILNLL
jgi:hypothetical protein